METLKANSPNYDPRMPILEAGYIIEHLFDCGPVMSSGMGASPLTHEEIRAYQANIGIELLPWEVRFIRRLSRDYVNESHNATKMNCPAPWNVDKVQERFNSILTRNSLRSMAKE